jgi:hypothetical protein
VLRIGPAAAAPFVGPFVVSNYRQDVSPHGLFLQANPRDGWVVTAGTADLIHIQNVGAVSSIEWHGLIMGTDA